MSSELAAALRGLIDEIAPKHDDPVPGQLPSCWDVLVELGLPGVGIEEGHGGSGGTLSDVIVIAQALGRHGLSSPFVESATANWALAAGGRPWGTGVNTVTLERGRAVLWARHCERLVIADDTGVGVLALAGTHVRSAESVAGEPLDDLSWDPAAVDAIDGVATTAVQARLGVLRAAALTGAIEGAYRMTRAYVKGREQFGQPLARIPAVAANLARMRAGLLQCEAALARAHDGRLESAAAARVLTALSATEVARLAHQLHGAMGITAEFGLHRFTAKLWAWRDADRDQRDWSLLLARWALVGGEAGLWDVLTA